MSIIAVIGSGAWGTALAHTYAASGHDVLLWSRNPDLTQIMEQSHENTSYLPGIKLSPSLSFTSDIAIAMKARVLLLACPAQHIRQVLQQMKPFLRQDHRLVLTCKGIDTESGLLLSDVIKTILPDTKPCMLTGPTFARDLGMGLPAAATLACDDEETLNDVSESLISRLLRLYKTDDLKGAQIGGAVKNVIAIACGIIHGLNFGESARAALITRGLAEIARLTLSLGGRRETLLGLSGVGDLMLTCNSMQSRNFSLGYELGQGASLEDILKKRTSVTEGITTAQAVIQLAKKKHIEMPIVTAVHACLYNNISVHDAVSQILERPARSERE